MNKDRSDIRDLLSARLRPSRKKPSAPQLRLVNPAQDAAPATTNEIMNHDEQEIAAANAIAAQTAMQDFDFASRVGTLTRMDVLCATQNRSKSPKPNKTP